MCWDWGVEGYQAGKLPEQSNTHFLWTSSTPSVSTEHPGLQTDSWVTHKLGGAEPPIALWQKSPFPANLGFHTSYADSYKVESQESKSPRRLRPIFQMWKNCPSGRAQLAQG